ncbi:MAG: endonuclease [Prevotellaceae bacterium]|nr:endonuclease [Prevotellaceae bacterium]
MLNSQNYNRENYKIVCYNVENYFDTVDDSLTNDAEFLPRGSRHWNYSKYKAKQVHIGKVLINIGGWTPPAIVGLCEVESHRALVDLTRYSVLRKFNYQFVHYDSPDARGVDVALLYQPKMFQVVNSKPIRISFKNFPDVKTRDVLLVTGKIPNGDTLHLFVCHLPSRLGGELESEERRIEVAQIVRTHIDSLMTAYQNPNIIVMGDFNDYPDNQSITRGIDALPPSPNPQPNAMYNLSLPLHLAGKGTYKHEGQWGMLDQFIVSGNLLNPASNIFTQTTDAHVFDADFLLEDDVANLGKKHFRTYNGMSYHSGYSDHLPMYADFWIKQ